MDRRVSERDPRKHLLDVPGLGRIGLEERPPHGRIEKEVAHLDHGPSGGTRRQDRAEDAPLDGDLRTFVRVGLPRDAPGPGDLGDRREGLAPEAERGDPEEVFGLGQLARRVCGLKASSRSSAEIPWPLSAILIRSLPPRSTVTSTRVAPASIAFSRSSLTTLAGRSTTSPAAIWLITDGGSSLMIPMGALSSSGTPPTRHYCTL